MAAFSRQLQPQRAADAAARAGDHRDLVVQVCRVRRLECRSAAYPASLTVVVNYVSVDGSEVEECRFRYDRGFPTLRSDDGGQTWNNPQEGKR